MRAELSGFSSRHQYVNEYSDCHLYVFIVNRVSFARGKISGA
jgi:hypothetical protein